jgi:DNA-binding HxlR family transcriptional regulator
MTQPTNLAAVELKSFAGMDCSIAQCVEAVGDRWSMLILRDCFLGFTRFDDFQRRLGISRNILHQRLVKLVDAGVLNRVPYCDHPARYDYRLTERGLDLWPVLAAMRQWGDRHAAPDGPPVEIFHPACQSSTHLDFVCGSCGEKLHPGNVTARPGPGRTGASLPAARVDS